MQKPNSLIIQKFFIASFVLICLLLIQMPAFAFSLEQNFTHYADKQDLKEALSDFAKNQNMSVSFSPNVTGNLSGHFENMPAKTFLSAMEAAFNIKWYRQSSVLHFYTQNESQRIFVSPKVIKATLLVDMLTKSQVLAPELPAEVMPNSEMLIINGPAGYLSQVQAAISAFESAQTTNYIMRVFPLKYSWAEDMTVNSMDTQVVIPGVASILKAMVSGQSLTGSTVTQMSSSVGGLMGQGLSATGQETNSNPLTAPNPNQAVEQNMGMVNIIADPRVNAVLITDAEYRMPYYDQVIKDLDKPVELVEIHAAIVDIDSNFQRSLGVDFQGSGSIGKNVNIDGSSSGGGSLDGITPTPGLISPGLSLSTLYSFGTDFFLAKVQALEDNGNARVLGKPSVLTMDNIQATLENTSTYYIKVEGKDAVDLFKVEAGTILRVTPHIIHNDGQSSIKLAVSVQDDQSDNSTNVEVGALPPIKQTKINTQAIVNEGQSLLIGGYYYEQESLGDSGVPGLKNIPVLGNLFKTTSKSTKRMERLILITPRIIRINDLPTPPPRVDNPSFSRSPTQNTYEERIPVSKPKAGCAKKVSPPTLVEAKTPVISPVLDTVPTITPVVNPVSAQNIYE